VRIVLPYSFIIVYQLLDFVLLRQHDARLRIVFMLQGMGFGAPEQRHFGSTRLIKLVRGLETGSMVIIGRSVLIAEGVLIVEVLREVLIVLAQHLLLNQVFLLGEIVVILARVVRRESLVNR